MFMVDFAFAIGLPISRGVSEAEGLNKTSNMFQEEVLSPQSPERTKAPWATDL